MSDLQTKFEEDWTKIVVAIVDERFVRAHTHTYTYTDIHSSDFISVQCHELHWTDNKSPFFEIYTSYRLLKNCPVSYGPPNRYEGQ